MNTTDQQSEQPGAKPGTATPFGVLNQVDAGALNVGYAEAGPADGPAVMLLHGWPYDIYSFAEVTPGLAAAGYRVAVIDVAAGASGAERAVRRRR